MASFSKFNQFVEDLGKKVHNLSTDAISVYLTNTAPSAANAIKGDLTGITEQNGYAAAALANIGYEQVSGVAKFAADDKVWTATGAGFGPFQYLVLYNDTPTSPVDPLIGYWDRGSSVSAAAGDQVTANFTDNTNLFQVS